MDLSVAAEFGLDSDVLHLNHGAYGVAPVAVRRAAAAWRDRAERNPHRFNRVEVPGLIAAARAQAAGFLGLDPERAAWVRNVSEGVSAVLGSLALGPGDELVIGGHGYGAVRLALGRHAERTGARVVTASFAVGAGEDEIVAAYAAACSPRTRLVVVDRITSPTATVLPVAAITAAVSAAVARGGHQTRVLIDAAHAPGQLADDIAGFGADYWIGNLHKWAYTPRGSAILWARPGADVAPSVLSWQLDDGYAAAFDYPGTWDYAGWLAVPDGLAYWRGIGGWDAVDGLARLVRDGQQTVADGLGVALGGLAAVPARTMRLVPLPAGRLITASQVDAFYEALSGQRVEVAPVWFDGAAYLRIAAAPYNTAGDYGRLTACARSCSTAADPAAVLRRAARGRRRPRAAASRTRRRGCRQAAARRPRPASRAR